MPRINSAIEIIKNGDPLSGAELGALKGVVSTANFVVSNAKTLAPTDEGRLRNSLSYKLSSGQSFAYNNVNGEKISENELISLSPRKFSAYAGTNLNYAIYPEFGTRYQAPQPYLRPAGALARGTSVTTVIANIQKEEMLGALKKGQERVKF